MISFFAENLKSYKEQNREELKIKALSEERKNAIFGPPHTTGCGFRGAAKGDLREVAVFMGDKFGADDREMNRFFFKSTSCGGNFEINNANKSVKKSCDQCINDGHNARTSFKKAEKRASDKKRKVDGLAEESLAKEAAKAADQIDELRTEKKACQRKLKDVLADNTKILKKMDADLEAAKPEPGAEDDVSEPYDFMAWMKYGLEMIMRENADGKNTESNLLMQEQYIAQFAKMGVLNKSGDKRGIIVDAPTARVMQDANRRAFKMGHRMYEQERATHKYLPAWSTLVRYQQSIDPFKPGIQHAQLLAGRVRASKMHPSAGAVWTLVWDECVIVENVIYQNGKVFGFCEAGDHEIETLVATALMPDPALMTDRSAPGHLKDVADAMESVVAKNLMYASIICNDAPNFKIPIYSCPTPTWVSDRC